MTAVAQESGANQFAPQTTTGRANLLDVFELRAWARAYLWSIGEYSLHEAADVLQRDAERDGLIERLGQDAVQQIIGDAFAPFWEADSEPS